MDFYVKRILLVEDEDLLLQSLCGSLRQSGHIVTGVASAVNALKSVLSLSYDICFLDIQLPDGNGLDLLPAIRASAPGMRIVVMTAMDLNEQQQSILRSYSCRFLPKPFGLRTVRALLNEDEYMPSADPAV